MARPLPWRRPRGNPLPQAGGTALPHPSFPAPERPPAPVPRALPPEKAPARMRERHAAGAQRPRTARGPDPIGKKKRPHHILWYDLVIFYGRSDWIRTSDPLLPKQVRYHAAPRSVTECFVRKRPCFGKGGPSRGRKGPWLPWGKRPTPAGKGPRAFPARRAVAGRGQGPIHRQGPEGTGRRDPSLSVSAGKGPSGALPCGRGTSPSVHTAPKRDLSSSRLGFQYGAADGLSARKLAAEKEKPRSKAGGFSYGAKDGT